MRTSKSAAHIVTHVFIGKSAQTICGLPLQGTIKIARFVAPDSQPSVISRNNVNNDQRAAGFCGSVLQHGAARARTSRRNRPAPIYAAVSHERDDFAWMIWFSYCLFSHGSFSRRNDGYCHLCMMQNSARNRSQKYAAQAMSLVSSDDDQIDMLAARHFEQVSFRSSPAGLNDGGYFLLRQKCRDAFLQIAFKILLNLFSD